MLHFFCTLFPPVALILSCMCLTCRHSWHRCPFCVCVLCFRVVVTHCKASDDDCSDPELPSVYSLPSSHSTGSSVSSSACSSPQPSPIQNLLPQHLSSSWWHLVPELTQNLGHRVLQSLEQKEQRTLFRFTLTGPLEGWTAAASVAFRKSILKFLLNWSREAFA